MSESEGTGRELQSVSQSPALPAEKTINLAQSDVLDLTGLDETQISEIKQQQAEGIVAVQIKAAEKKLDVTALDAALTSFTEQTARAVEAGTHATIQHSQTSSIGKTEVVIGNTERAASGKVSSSSDSLQNNSLTILGVIGIVIILLAVFAKGG
ncbi:hypothetical protein [Magnetospirillum molischianum]|uniref:Uncharacterized protein n=1 Tax=Magnetospirillum molischianum DSM 120 TaxID=1150626 RepID=H8FX38_MAGML|nr:hypothetical protein [Magnetospirillum molischianum]CCG42926.1 hypothetical protein PHAMO_510040 [Magnetospirillum molischianum DSM 120]